MAEAAAKDSSMEDILASIRKIITSDSEKNDSDVKKTTDSDRPEVPSDTAPTNSAPVPEVPSVVRENQSENRPVAMQNSLAALASRMKEQTPSQPSTPKIAPGTQAETSSTAKNPMDTEDSPISGDVSPSGSLAALAVKVRADVDHSSEVRKPEPMGEATQSTDITSEGPDTSAQKSDNSLKDLARRVAASSSQQPDEKPSKTAIEPTVEPKKTEIESEFSDSSAQEPAKSSIEPERESKAVEPTVSAPLKSELPVHEDAAAFREALVSPSTQAAVTGSMDRLRNSVESLDSAQVEAALRPLLKEWLDNNLPSMVEKMVQQEISRITTSKK